MRSGRRLRPRRPSGIGTWSDDFRSGRGGSSIEQIKGAANAAMNGANVRIDHCGLEV